MKEQIRLIIDEIRPQFSTLGDFGFLGVGIPEEVTSSFIVAYEGYVKAKNLYFETTGHMPENDSNCQFVGKSVEESELEAAYSIVKAQGFLPPSLMERIFDFATYMNSFFMAVQRE